MFNSSYAGLTINNMPKKPINTADHLLIPTFSDKKNIEPRVTKIGPPKVRLTTSANGISLKAMNSATIANVPLTALKACSFGLVVL